VAGKTTASRLLFVVMPFATAAFADGLIAEAAAGSAAWTPWCCSGAKMGSHSAKSRQESGGVWTVICPGKQHFANLLDSSRPARGLIHTEEVTGSIPVSPTQLSGQLRSCDWPFSVCVQQ